jgi:hypothetical protein
LPGEGPERGDLEARIARAGLQTRITLPGWTDRVSEFLSPADIFVRRPLSGGFSAGGARRNGERHADRRKRDRRTEGFSGRQSITALLVPPSDSARAVDALARLIDDDSLRESPAVVPAPKPNSAYSFSASAAASLAALENVLAGRAISVNA